MCACTAPSYFGLRRARDEAATDTIPPALRAESLGAKIAAPGPVRLPSRPISSKAGRVRPNVRKREMSELEGSEAPKHEHILGESL